MRYLYTSTFRTKNKFQFLELKFVDTKVVFRKDGSGIAFDSQTFYKYPYIYFWDDVLVKYLKHLICMQSSRPSQAIDELLRTNEVKLARERLP